MEKQKWVREISAGGVVYKIQDGRVFILLIQPKGANYGAPRGYWAFPKGKYEEGEDMKETALREVREEGGVHGEIEAELGYIKFFKSGGSQFESSIKFVHYFLMKYISGDPADHDKEIAECAWFVAEEVESKLKFKHDKEIFNRALTYLNSKGPV